MDTKTVLIVGGLGIGAVILFALLKQAQANRTAALNQPGLIYQPSLPAQGQMALGNIVSGLGSGLGNLFANLGSSNSGDLNDPGLESQDETAFPGMDYSYANSSSYSPSFATAPVSDLDASSAGSAFED